MEQTMKKEECVTKEGKRFTRITFSNGLVFDPTTIPKTLSDEAQHILDVLDEKVFIVEDNAVTEERMKETIEKFIVFLQYGYEFSEFRNHPVQFKFKKEDKDIHVISFRHLLINLIMWYPLICIKAECPDAIDFDDKMIITENMMKDMGRNFIRNYMNHWYVVPYRKLVDIRRLSRIMVTTMFLLTRISANFAPFIGISISIDMFRELEKRLPGYSKYLHYRLDETKQPNEIEQEAETAAKEHLKIIMEDEQYNLFKSLIQDVKKQQLAEVQTVTGMKPGFDATVIPKPLNHNWITGDIGSIPKYYLNCIGGRKAAIINNEFMGTAGHLLILTAISTNSVKLSKTTVDCGTVNAIPIEVKTKNHLEKINGRRYRIGSDKKYHTVDSSKDSDLIGKTIWMRSPMTCACKDGVCRECYGDLYYVNRYLNSAGELGAIIVMNPVTQEILSAKHYQGTSSKPIEFNEDFNKFFEIASTNIIINPTADDISGYNLVIYREDLRSSDPDEDELDRFFNTKKGKKTRKKASQNNDDDDTDTSDDDSLLEMKYYTDRFYVVKGPSKKGKDVDSEQIEVYEFQDKFKKSLYIHDDFVNRLVLNSDDKGDFLSIPLENISTDEFIFIAEVENNELTKPMKAIERLINNRFHEGCDSIEQLAQKMLDLLVDARLSALSVHGEMIMYKLIRRADNILQRPNFNVPIFRNDYQLLTIKTSLKKDPSINTAMSTPFLKYQLIQDPVTFDKTATSDYDEMYRMFREEENYHPVTREGDEDDLYNPTAEWVFSGSTYMRLDRSIMKEVI